MYILQIKNMLKMFFILLMKGLSLFKKKNNKTQNMQNIKAFLPSLCPSLKK